MCSAKQFLANYTFALGDYQKQGTRAIAYFYFRRGGGRRKSRNAEIWKAEIPVRGKEASRNFARLWRDKRARRGIKTMKSRLRDGRERAQRKNQGVNFILCVLCVPFRLNISSLFRG
jgi:hypothetical protein